MPVVVIGGGVMGGAIASGLVRDGWTRVSVVEAVPARRAQLAGESGLRVGAVLDEVVDGAQVVVLAVKPADATKVLDQAAGLLPADALVCRSALEWRSPPLRPSARRDADRA